MTAAAKPIPASSAGKTPNLRFWSTPDALDAGMFAFTGAVAAVHLAIGQGVFPTVPDTVRNVDHAETQLRDAAMRYSGDTRGEDTLPAEYLARVLDGEDLNDGFTEAVDGYVRARQYREAGAALIAAMQNQLTWRRPRIFSDCAPTMLDGLRTQLRELLNRVDQVAATLDGLNIADPSAVAAGTDAQRGVFPELPDLVARYWRIRNAQRVLYVASNQPPPGNTANSSHWTWAEFFTAQPFWEIRTGQALAAGTDAITHTQRLLHVAALGADVAWLPSYRELLDRYEEWWNDDAEPLPAPELPPLSFGQHHHVGTWH